MLSYPISWLSSSPFLFGRFSRHGVLRVVAFHGSFFILLHHCVFWMGLEQILKNPTGMRTAQSQGLLTGFSRHPKMKLGAEHAQMMFKQMKPLSNLKEENWISEMLFMPVAFPLRVPWRPARFRDLRRSPWDPCHMQLPVLQPGAPVQWNGISPNPVMPMGISWLTWLRWGFLGINPQETPS